MDNNATSPVNVLERQDEPAIALHSGLEHLRRDTAEAVLHLASLLPAGSITARAPSQQACEQLQAAVVQLSRAAVAAQSALNRHAEAGVNKLAPDSNQQLPHPHQQDTRRSHDQVQDHSSSRANLYKALDHLQQQAAAIDIRSARAAIRSACHETAADMQQVLDVLLNMTDSALKAQNLLRQYAGVCTAVDDSAGQGPAAAGFAAATTATATDAQQHENFHAQGHQAAMSAKQSLPGSMISPQSQHTAAAAAAGQGVTPLPVGGAGPTMHLSAKRQAAVEVYNSSGNNAVDENGVQHHAAATSKRQRMYDQALPPTAAAAESSADHICEEAVAQPDAAAATTTTAAASAGHDAAAGSLNDSIKHLTQQLLHPDSVEQAAKSLVELIERNITDSSVGTTARQAVPSFMLLLSSTIMPGVQKEAAATALSKLVNVLPCIKTAVVAAGGIQQLLAVMVNSNSSVILKQTAGCTLKALLWGHAEHLRAAAADSASAAALRQLLLGGFGRDFAAEVAGMAAAFWPAEAAQQLISALVMTLSKYSARGANTDVRLLLLAMQALSAFCNGGNINASRHRVLLAEAGGIMALISLLQQHAAANGSGSNHQTRITAAVAWTLERAMIDSANNCAAVVAAGGIELLGKLLFSDDAAMQAAAAEGLRRIMLSSDDSRKAVTEAAQGSLLHRLVQLLSSRNSAVLTAATNAVVRMGHLADQTIVESIRNAGAIKHLVNRLSCGLSAATPNAAVIAAHGLRLLVETQACYRPEAGAAISPLLKLLNADEHTAERSSTNGRCCCKNSMLVDNTLSVRCIAALHMIISNNAGNQEQLIQHGGLAIIVKLLSNCSNFRLLQYSIAILSCLLLAANPAAGSIVMGDHKTSDSAIRARNRSFVAAAGAIKPLVALLSDNSSNSDTSSSSHVCAECKLRLNYLAVNALHGLAHKHDSNKRDIVMAGAIKPLVHMLDYLQHCTVADTVQGVHCGNSDLVQDTLLAAAGALASLALDYPSHQAEIAAAGGIKQLVKLLAAANSSNSSSLVPAGGAADALLSLATTQTRCKSIVVAGAIPYLVRLLMIDHVSNADVVHEKAARVLAAVAQDNDRHQAAIAAETGAVSRLVHLTQHSSSAGVRAAATAVLREMKVHPAAASSIPDDLV